MNAANQDYRQRIYEEYVSRQMMPGPNTLTAEFYRIWADSAAMRFGGWLPDERCMPILDMGCGSGNFLFLLQRLGYTDLTGVDLSPEQAALARQWCPRARIIEGDVRVTLEESAGHFGLISGLDIIEHLRKDEVLSFLELVFKALRPGGRLILQTPNGASPWVGSVAYSDFTHEWFYSPRGLERILGMVGFENYRARESKPYPHGGKSWMRSILWRLVRTGLRLYDLIETGGENGGVYTRVFVATALKGIA